MIASPIEGTDKLLGIFVILDVPQDVLDEVAKIIGIISYFISQLLSRRNEEKRLKAYIYNDALTGAYNRRAYREYIGGGLDISSPFGYLVCEIRDLEKANKTLGFDSGDKMVIEAANQLMEVFGKDNVYRSSGIELVAFGFETDEAYFNNDVERFRKLAKSKNVNVYIGAVYCIYGTKDINMVIERAAYKLAQDKE
jgi:diguanylate cyclase (GGDEF)-like protein